MKLNSLLKQRNLTLVGHDSKQTTELPVYLFTTSTRMWANAQCEGRLAEHRWRPLFNAAKFG